MVNTDRITDIVIGGLIGLLLSESFEVFGVESRINSGLENIKDNVTSDNRA